MAGSSVGQQEGILMGEATWQREEGWEPTKQKDGEGAGNEGGAAPSRARLRGKASKAAGRAGLDLWAWNTQRPGREDSLDALAPILQWALCQVLHSRSHLVRAVLTLFPFCGQGNGGREAKCCQYRVAPMHFKTGAVSPCTSNLSPCQQLEGWGL